MSTNKLHIYIILILSIIIAIACSRKGGAILDENLKITISTSPANGASGIAINTNLVATFSIDMDPATITETSFTLKDAANNVIGGAVSYNNKMAIFNPTNDLTNDTTYTATILTSVKDMAGTAIANAKTWSFTTVTRRGDADTDTTPPTVEQKSPDNGATNVDINTNINATFSETINPASITNTSFLLKKTSDGTAVDGTPSTLDRTATFDPANNLENDTNYTVTIFTSVTDISGNALVNAESWSFTTGSSTDTTAPTIVATTPNDDTPSAETGINITATFNEDMNAASIDTTTFTLKQGDTPIDGDVSYNSKIATFNPSSDLIPNKDYTVTISKDVKDMADNCLSDDFSWTFNIGSSNDQTLDAPKDLRVDDINPPKFYWSPVRGTEWYAIQVYDEDNNIIANRWISNDYTYYIGRSVHDSALAREVYEPQKTYEFRVGSYTKEGGTNYAERVAFIVANY